MPSEEIRSTESISTSMRQTPLSATNCYKSAEIGLHGITEDIDFPEGGTKAWAIVVASWCGLFTIAFSNSIGVIQYQLSQNQLSEYSESQISWIFSIWLFLCYLGGAQTGPVFDTHGVHVLLVPGSVAYVLSFIFLSFSKDYYQFILGFSVLGGISASMIFTPCIAVLAHWFKSRRGIATGIACSATAVGGIILPLVFDSLIDKIGYGWTVRVFALMVCILCSICAVTLRDRHREIQPTTKKATIDFSAFKEKPYLFCVLGTFLCEWAIFVPLNFLKIYASANNMSNAFGTNLLVFFSTASVFGRTLPGYFADKLGSFNVMIFTSLMAGISCLCIWLPGGHSKAGLVLFAVFFGLFSGSTISLTAVCLSRISLTREYGKRYGTCYTIASFATLTGLPLSGSLEGHNFLGMILFCGVCYILAAASFFAVRMIGPNRKLTRF